MAPDHHRGSRHTPPASGRSHHPVLRADGADRERRKRVRALRGGIGQRGRGGRGESDGRRHSGGRQRPRICRAELGLACNGSPQIVAGQIVHPPVFGEQFLSASDTHKNDTDCGSHVVGLTTDSAGKAYLHYWAPGVVAGTTTTWNATAKIACSVQVCPSRLPEGNAPATTIAIKPYESRARGPARSQELDLIEWARGGTHRESVAEHGSRAFNHQARAHLAQGAGDRNRAHRGSAGDLRAVQPVGCAARHRPQPE